MLEGQVDHLDVKGTAWLAGFPVNNVEIISNDDSQNSVDYIGPSIDIGFRLTKFSNPGKFVVSIELAYLLTKCQSITELQFSYSGKEVLKGVLENKPYPVIWLKTNNTSITQGADDTKLIPDISKDHIRDFCLSFIKANTEKLFVPFIFSDEEFSKMPDGYIEKYNKSIDVLQGIEEQFRESWDHPGEQP